MNFPDAAHADLPSRVLGGRYRVEQMVGRGGMATVYRATDLKHNRAVAVKIMGGQVYGEGAQRFLREISIAANLTHPHILPLHDSGETDGMLYYVMPFVDGPTLKAKLRAQGTIAVGEAVRILRDVADALGAAHAHGVVHRDIKPDNIMMLGGSAVVADFGVAKAVTAAAGELGEALTRTGISAGTPAYMAPEQVAADPATDHRADLYALGVVAYEVFTGETPFAGRTPTQLAAAIMSEEPPSLAMVRPDLPPGLTALVSRLLAKDPMSRPANAGEVVAALDALETSSPTVAGQLRTARPFVGWRLPIVAAAVTLIAVVGAFVWARGGGRGAARSEEAFWAAGQARSVAVMPFDNISGDTASGHFADGLTEELIAALGEAGLRVSARTSVVRLRNRGLSIRNIADTLRVATVLEGSARRAGDSIRVYPRLVRAVDDSVLWSGRFDLPTTTKNVFGVQDTIVRAIVAAVHARMDGRRSARLVGVPTTDLDAYWLYQRGKSSAATRDRGGLEAAMTDLRAATERDSGFALAFAVLSDVYVNLGNYGYRPRQQTLSDAEIAADRAIALDSTAAEAWASKGFVLTSRLSFNAAEEAFLRAIRLNPSYPWSYHYYSLVLMMQLRMDEALRQNNRALELDRFQPPLNANHGNILLAQGETDSARAALRKALAIAPGLPLALSGLGFLEAFEGRYTEALPLLVEADAKAHFPAVAPTLAYVYRRLGRTAESDAILAKLRGDDTDDRARINYGFAVAMMGNVDSAYAMLRHRRWDIPSAINLRTSALLEPLRRDARYGALLQEIGLKR